MQEHRLTPQETQALLSVAESVTSILDPGEIMRRICREATRLAGAESAVFWEADEVACQAWPAAAYHMPKRLYGMAALYPADELPRPLVDAFLTREPDRKSVV